MPSRPCSTRTAQVEQVLKLTLDVTDETKKIYQLSRLRQIGELMQGVLDLDRLLHFVLTCVTAGQALGFNRALLFLVDKDRNLLEGKMGVGPASAEEAGRIWSQITRDAPTLEDLLARYDRAVPQTPSTLDQLARDVRIPLSDTSHIAVACAFGRRPIVVSRPFDDPRVSEDFRRLVGSREFVLAPLIAHGEPVGVILADNLFSGQPISEDHVELLSMFANQAAIAIENAGNYRRLQEEKMHLEAAYRDLGEAEDKLVRSERLGAVGRMAAHVAHEIRNPLVTIGGFANTLLEHPDSPKEDVLRYLKIIVSEVRRLEEILARVMDFTRPPKALLREGAVEPVIRETIEPLRQRAQDQHVEIQLDLPPDEARLQIDADQMKQVFLNLFRNALDAMRDGGRLTVRVAHEPRAVADHHREQRRPDPPRGPAEALRAVLHHQAGRHRAGPVGQPAHRPGPRRQHPRRQQPRTRHGIRHHPAAQGPAVAPRPRQVGIDAARSAKYHPQAEHVIWYAHH